MHKSNPLNKSNISGPEGPILVRIMASAFRKVPASTPSSKASLPPRTKFSEGATEHSNSTVRKRKPSPRNPVTIASLPVEILMRIVEMQCHELYEAAGLFRAVKAGGSKGRYSFSSYMFDMSKKIYDLRYWTRFFDIALVSRKFFSMTVVVLGRIANMAPKPPLYYQMRELHSHDFNNCDGARVYFVASKGKKRQTRVRICHHCSKYNNDAAYMLENGEWLILSHIARKLRLGGKKTGLLS
ncbi:MAG: hypothetical protein Q9159_000929 [Coniocarpon cinnabarinum]